MISEKSYLKISKGNKEYDKIYLYKKTKKVYTLKQ